MNKISVLLVDDHKLFREGLKMLIKTLPMVDEVSEVADGNAFLESIEQNLPDLIFMDIDMPGLDGISATISALEKYPELNIIGLSMFAEEEYFSQMIEAGAKGFLLKNSGIQEVESAIINILEGKNYFSQEILSTMLKGISRKRQPLPVNDLSEREIEVLYQICKGWSNNEIAGILNISKRTVDKHRENLLLKTRSKNTVGLVIYAVKNKIVEL